MNLAFLPSVTPPTIRGMSSIVEGGVEIVETAGNNRRSGCRRWEAGIKVIDNAPRSDILEGGIDGLGCRQRRPLRVWRPSARGYVPSFILLPRAAEELKGPLRRFRRHRRSPSLVADLSLGADGINMGTRFMATKEAPIHEHVKQALVAASELDTRLVMRPLRNTERVLKNAAVERLLGKEKALGPKIKFEDILPEVAGVYPRIMKDGEMDAGACRAAWWRA